MLKRGNSGLGAKGTSQRLGWFGHVSVEYVEYS